MRALVTFFFLATALGLHAQGEVFAPAGSYAGELPHGDTAKIIFRASVGDFTTGPLKMRLIGQDAATQEDVITLIVPATRRGRIIRAEFPFGGRYIGRYTPARNVIVGRFSGFPNRGRTNIPRQRFELTHVSTNGVSGAIH
jgi:hypothetical protein